MSTVTTPIPYDGPQVDLLGYAEAAKILGCSTSMIRWLIANGRLTRYPYADCQQSLVTRESVLGYQHTRIVAELSEGV